MNHLSKRKVLPEYGLIILVAGRVHRPRIQVDRRDRRIEHKVDPATDVH